MHPSGPHPIRPASVGPPPPVPTANDELMFFDRAKKALESGGTYDEFLKLLNLFSRDIIDTKTLIDRAEIFLGDGDLMAQFKDLLSWDDRVGNRDEGPPGSLRTSAPDYYTARPPDDGQGPSYRRLPDSVSRLRLPPLRTRFSRHWAPVGGATRVLWPGSASVERPGQSLCG